MVKSSRLDAHTSPSKPGAPRKQHQGLCSMSEDALTFPLLEEILDSQQANGRHQVIVRAVEEALSKIIRRL